MKRLIVILFLVIIGRAEVSAQGVNPDTLQAVVPYSTFPIGAMRYPVADTLSHMYGMNFNWYGFPDGNTNTTFPEHHRPNNPSSVTPILDPFYYDTTNTTHSYSDLYELLQEAAYGNDVRVYMPGTSGATSEYIYKWNYNTGGTVFGFPNQWQISTFGTNAGDSVLSDLGDAQSAPYTSDGYVYGALNKDHIDSFSYDFIFYFDSVQLVSVGDTDKLYTLEFWKKSAGNTTFTLAGADIVPISKGLYNSTLKIANTQVPGQAVGADTLFSWAGQKSRNYKLLRHVMYLRNDYSYSGSDVTGNPQVDVRLRTYKKIPIWVRGLRIRDWRAMRLLGGYADTRIKSAISQLLTVSSNKVFKSWTIGNENVYKNFHCWSYINNLLVHNGAPPANILSPPWKGNDLLLRVLHDQTDFKAKVKPGVVWDEETIFTGRSFHSRWYDEGQHRTIDTLYVDDYGGYGGPRALPSAVSSDSASLLYHGVRVYGNYGQFTSQSQDTMLGYSSEATGGGSGDYQVMLNNARSAYEIDPANQTPFYLMAQTLVKAASTPKWSVDTLFFAYRDSLYQYALDTSRHFSDPNKYADSTSRKWADSLYIARIFTPYLSTHSGTLDENALFDVMYEDRNPSPAELYYQMWKGVLTGMKGYALNVGYSDAIEQHGFLRDSSWTDPITHAPMYKLLKTNEQHNYLVHWWNLLSPYRNTPQGYYLRSIPLLPCFKELNKHIRDMIQNDLVPIAPTLAKLTWKGTISWYKRDSTPTYMTLFPLKNIHSKTLGGSLDSTSKTYVQCSVLQDPKDSAAKYVALQNRRLWCDPLDTLTTDYRTISFQVDSTKFPTPYSHYSYWRISDVAGILRDTVMNTKDTFFFTVKPGQGKLFRVAPAIGLTLGQMATNTFNNARHIASVESDTGVTRFLTTYQRGGNIVVSFPVETPTGASKRILDNPSDTVINSSG